mmetsp:Transcript_13540/g.44584  ORF Transcript_13540/g.44584 Transcript_13540/m.44584 type:complete len:210 (-) Transcript_13540:2266-2895(-)
MVPEDPRSLSAKERCIRPVANIRKAAVKAARLPPAALADWLPRSLPREKLPRSLLSRLKKRRAAHAANEQNPAIARGHGARSIARCRQCGPREQAHGGRECRRGRSGAARGTEVFPDAGAHVVDEKLRSELGRGLSDYDAAVNEDFPTGGDRGVTEARRCALRRFDLFPLLLVKMESPVVSERFTIHATTAVDEHDIADNSGAVPVPCK